jgi:hypothetical protein
MAAWKAPIAIISLCVGLSALATLPFFFLAEVDEDESRWTLHVPETLDLPYHVSEAELFYEGLKAGSAYPIWLAGANKGFGAPVTAYYPPGTYYLMSGFYFLFKDWTMATLGAYLLMMICSAAAMYLYARHWFSRAGAVFAMVAYIVIPFHLYELYVRGTFGELGTYIWMPLLLLFTDRIFRWGPAPGLVTGPEGEALPAPNHSAGAGSRRAGVMLNIAGLALCYGASLWTHVPSIHPFSLALGIYIVILGVANRDWKGVLYCGVSIALALGLSAAYWYPALAGRDLIFPGFIDPDLYHKSYVFSPDFYSDSLIWVFNLVSIIVCAAILLAATRRNQVDSNPLRSQVVFWAVMGCFASFMATSYSYQIGRRIPMISIGHRPFRMLMITALIAALLVGACGHVASAARSTGRKHGRLLSGIAVAVLLITIGFSIVRVIAPVHLTPTEDLSEIMPRTAFDPDPNDLNLVVPRTVRIVSTYDNLDDVPLSEPAKLADGHGEVTIDKWDPEHRELLVELTESDRLSIRTFNFPGWTATVDGHQARLGTGAELGEMFLDLEAGSHAITLEFLETPVRRRGKLLNLAALIVVAGIVCVASALRRRNRNATGEERFADTSVRGSGEPLV